MPAHARGRERQSLDSARSAGQQNELVERAGRSVWLRAPASGFPLVASVQSAVKKRRQSVRACVFLAFSAAKTGLPSNDQMWNSGKPEEPRPSRIHHKGTKARRCDIGLSVAASASPSTPLVLLASRMSLSNGRAVVPAVGCLRFNETEKHPFAGPHRQKPLDDKAACGHIGLPFVFSNAPDNMLLWCGPSLSTI